MNKPRVQSKKSHRFLSMLLSAAMLLGTVQAAGLWVSAAEEPAAEPEPAVQAEEVSPYAVFGDFDYYTLSAPDGHGLTAGIRGYTGDSTEVVVPSEVDGYKVTEIGSSAFKESNITSITIPEGVTEIGYEAFFGCSSLKSIVLPDSLTNIVNDAFPGCSSLESIVIPEGVTEIAMNTFEDCSALKEVTLPNSLEDISIWAFRNCDSLTTIHIPQNVNSISPNAFIDCDALISFEVDENNPNYSSEDGVLFDKEKTELICYPANKGEESYKVPDTVESILSRVMVTWDVYAGAFDGNLALKDVTLSESMKSIDGYTFTGCDNLTTVEIPRNITSISQKAFEDSVTTIRGYAGSYAQTFAEENGYEFVALTEPVDETEQEIASVREAYAAIPDASSVKVTDEEALDALQARYDALLALGVTEEEIGADTARMTAAREAIQALWEQAAALNEQMTALPETAAWSDRAAVNAVTAALDELAGRGIEANSDNYSNYARYEAALQPIQAIENSIEGIENSIAALDPWKYGRSAQYEEILAQVAALESQGVASDEISNYALIAQFMELDQQAQAALTSIAEDIKALPNSCTEDDKAAVEEIQAAMDTLKAAPYGMTEDELKEALNAVAGEDVYSIFQAAVAVVNPEPEEPSEPSEPSGPSKPSDGNKPANNPTTGDNGLSMAVLAALVLSAGAFLGLKKRREA